MHLTECNHGGRFSKNPVTYRARKAILETMIRLPWKAALLICFRNKERQNNCQVSKIETCSYLQMQWDLCYPKSFEKQAPEHISMAHFRVSVCLGFKASPGAQMRCVFQCKTKSLSFEWFCTKTRFQPKANSNSELAYYLCSDKSVDL